MNEQEIFEFDGFEGSNTTSVPDVLFDVLLPILTGAELKVLLYIIRRTRGFKKDTDAISLTQFEKGITKRDGEQLDGGCGLNRETICRALDSLEAIGCVKRQKRTASRNDKDTTLYSVRFKGDPKVVGKNDYVPSRKKRLPNLVGKNDYPSRIFRKEVVGKSDLQVTVLQETVLQEVTCVANATPPNTFFAEQDEQPELLPDDNATEDESDTHSQGKSETDLTEEVEQDVPQEQQSSAAPPDAPGKKPKRTRKRRVKLEKPDELLQARIDRVYSFFDALAEETTGVEKKHARNDTETAAIIAWLQTNPTEKVLQEVYKEMWDEPTNTRTGFSWKKNMKIHNVLSQYESRALPILAARKKVEQKKPPVDITTIDPRRIRGSEILPEGVLLAMIEAEKKETEEQAKPRMTSAEMRAAAKLRVAAEEAEKARRA